jgi:hypothetical protein
MPDDVKKQIDPSGAQDLNQILNTVHEEGREALSKDLEKAAAAKSGKKEPETVESQEEEKREASEEGTPEEKKEVVPEPKKPRFQTVEEYERALEEKEAAYKEIQADASRKGERLRTLERTVTDKKDEEEWRKRVVEEETKYVDFLDKRAGQTLDAIDALDEDDPEYNAKVRKIRAEEFKDIKAYEREHVDLIFNPKTIQPQKQEQPPQEIPQETREEAERFIATGARKHGIDPQNETFRGFIAKSPDKDDKGNPLGWDQQLNWAIDQTKEHFVSQWRPAKATPQPGNGGQPPSKRELEAPMGKGAAVPKPKTEERVEPISIDTALGKVRQERTL